MRKHEAEQEAKRLNAEHPDRTSFRWVAVSHQNDLWTVFKVPRAGRGHPAPAATEAEPDSPKVRHPRSRRTLKPTAGTLKGITKRRQVRVPALILVLALAAWGLWQLRLLFRPFYMILLVRHPALVSIPLLAGGAAFLAHQLLRLAKRTLARRRADGKPNPAAPSGSEVRSRERASHQGGAKRVSKRATAPGPHRPSGSSIFDFARGWQDDPWLLVRRTVRGLTRSRGPVLSFVVCGTLGFLFAAGLTSSWTGSAIYRHTDYGALTLDMLHERQVRIKPYEVAQRQAENSLNSPTERPTNLHIVNVDGRLLWTSARDPEGFFRKLTKPTKGLMSVEATSSGPGVKQSGPRYDGDFRYGPGMRISESIRWQVYKKKCYTCDVAEMTALPTAKGPVVIAPYIRYKGGWLVRRPTFGGVYVIHPDGRIDDLSPQEAARQAALRESGRIYPEKLARRSAEAYKFKRGVWNRLFVHTDQLEIADTEQNRQPFLQDFAGIGPQWVTTLKPRGRTFTTAGVMTTDAVSGESRIWLVRRGQALIGNQKAIEIVRGENFPGIVFAQEADERTSRNFEVVEPRQIFPRGRLQFLLSIIPHSANRVTMSVIVDAESQQVVAKFPASPEGDDDLIAYLRSARLPKRPGDERGTPEGTAPPVQDREPGTRGAEPGPTLRRLLRENRIEQRSAAGRVSGLKAQERDLLRLLRDIEKGQ